jgi:tetratricopeptide (TPR) repeat protein
VNRVSLSILAIALGLAAVSPQLNSPALAKHRDPGENPETVGKSDKNFNIGVAKFKAGDFDGAIDAFLQSVYFSRNNYQPVAYLWLGKSYMEKNEDPKAIDALKKAAEQTMGGNALAHLLIAEIHFRNGNDDDCIRELNLSISQTTGIAPEAHNLMGKEYERKGDLVAANDQFRFALGDPPWTYTDAWMNLAECDMKQKQFPYALAQFKGMLTSNKKLRGLDYPRIYLDMGLCLLSKGDHQGAIDNWKQALAYDANCADAHLQLGMLFDSENHMSSAIAEYKQYIGLSSDEHKVSRAKERITFLEQKMNPAEADPEKEKPSMYMREQAAERNRRVQQLQQQQRVQQQQQPTGSSGF